MTFLEEQTKVRLFYGELQSYLEYAPKDDYQLIKDRTIWEEVNSTIDLLNEATGKDYNRFKIFPGKDSSIVAVRPYAYKAKLGALIATLYQEYFFDYDEPDPLSKSKSPSTIINNNNNLQQSQQQYMTLTLSEMQKKINQRLSQTTDEKEKTFLTQLKEHLHTITSVFQLIQLVLSIAQQSGLDIHVANHVISTLLA